MEGKSCQESGLPAVTPKRRAWNKGRLVGQKRPLLPKRVWAIRARLKVEKLVTIRSPVLAPVYGKSRDCEQTRALGLAG